MSLRPVDRGANRGVLREFAGSLSPNGTRRCRRSRPSPSPHRDLQALHLPTERPSNVGKLLDQDRHTKHLGCPCAAASNGSPSGLAPTQPRCPLVFAGDLPASDQPAAPLPRRRRRRQAPQAARADPDPFVRLAVEFLARTGLRKGELLDLTIDAVVQIGSPTGFACRSEAPHRPLHPAAPPTQGAPRRLARAPPSRLRSDYLFIEHGRRIPSRVDDAVANSRHGRDRTRHPTPDPPHLGHPGNQPGHVPRSIAALWAIARCG